MAITISESFWETVAKFWHWPLIFSELLLHVKYSSKHLAYISLKNSASTYEMGESFYYPGLAAGKTEAPVGIIHQVWALILVLTQACLTPGPGL